MAKLGARRIGLAVVAAVVALTAVVVLRAELGAERARASLVRALEARLGAGARVELVSFELALSERRLHARGVQVRAAWGALAARELTATVSWSDLLRGEVAPEAFELRGAEIRVDARSSRSAHGLIGDLPALRVHDGALTVQVDHGELALRGVKLELDGERVAFAAARGHVVAGGRTTPLGSVELRGRRQAQALLFDAGSLIVGDTRVALSALVLPSPLGSGAHGRVRVEGELPGLLAHVAPGAALPLEGHATIEGNVVLGPQGPAFALDVALVAPRFAGRPLGPRASAHVARSVGAAALSMRASFEPAAAGASTVAAPAAAPAQLVATIEPSSTGFTLSAIEARLGGTTLTGSASVAADRVQARLVAAEAAIEDLVAALDVPHVRQGALTGRGEVALRVEGPLAAPSLALQAELQQGTLLGAAFERATLAVRSDPETRGLVIERLALQHGRSRVLAENLTLRERDAGRAAIAGELRVEKLPLSELWRLLGTEEGAAPGLLQGEADGRIALADDARRGTTAVLELQLRAPTLHGLRFAAGSLKATLGGDGRVELRSLALRDAGSSLALTGALGGAGPLDVRGKLERISLAQLVSGAPSWLGVSGTASGTATFTGKASAPEARIDVTLDALALLSVPLGRQPLRAELVSTTAGERRCGDGAPALELGSLRSAGAERAWILCGGGQGVRAALALGAGGELPLRGRLAVERVDLASLLLARGAEGGKRVPARASLSLEVSGGGLRAPGSLSFALAVRELSVGEGSRLLAAAKPFELRATRGALSVSGGELLAEHTRLRLGARGTLPHAKLTAEGTIAASALLAIAPLPLVTDAFGEVAIDVALPLDGTSPHFLLKPQDAIVHFGPGIVARKLRGSIALEADGLRFEQISAQVGAGTLEMQGTLRRRGAVLDRYDLTLRAQDVAIEPLDRFTLGLDADVRLRSGDGAAPPVLSGRVRVERFVYGRHIELPHALIAMNQADRRERASYDPARDRVAFDLVLEQAAPLQVRNRMIDAELRVLGDARTLRLVGTSQRFGLLGGLEVARGRVLFHGDEFEIARGAVRFGEETRVAPVFELRAVAKKRTRKDTSIVLEAKGDRETFSLDVRCDAGGARVLAEPFACEFARDELRCDRFEQLATLWSCPLRG